MSRGLALVGIGKWGKNLLRNFETLGALRLVCDLDAGALSSLRHPYSPLETTCSFDEVLAHPHVDRVVIATPSYTHYPLARQALLAGKDVYVEKPLALSALHGRELTEFAKDRGLVLMVGHILRYHPHIVRLQELVEGGELGALRYIASHRLANDRMQGVESVLWNYGPHDLSLILPLAAEQPTEVKASPPVAVVGEVDDVRTLQLTFPSGIAAHIYISTVSPYKEHKLTVVGDKGTAIFDDTRSWEEKLTVVRGGERHSFEVQELEPLQEECHHFLECCEKRLTPLTDGEDALLGLEVLECASGDALPSHSALFSHPA